MADTATDTPADTEKATQDLLATVASRLSDLTTLTIVTAVCDVQTAPVAPDDPRNPALAVRPLDPAKVNAFQTRINMVDGDIQNVISTAFMAADYKPLFDFHLNQVTTSRELITGNLKAICDLATQLIPSS